MNNNTEKRAHRPLALTAILLLAVISGSCADPTKATPAKTEVTLEPGVFKVEHPELFRLVKIEERNLPLELNSNGAVAPDLNRTIHVSSMGSGRAVELKVRLGDYVQKGQELLVISSADLGSAAGDYQKARADEVLSGKALARSRDLYSHGALPEKDLQVAQDSEDKAKVDLQTAEQKVLQLGGDPQHPGALIELRAPVSGTIVEQNVAGFEGVKSLDNSPNLFTIADLSQVWVLCDVYENDLGAVRVGDESRNPAERISGQGIPRQGGQHLPRARSQYALGEGAHCALQSRWVFSAGHVCRRYVPFAPSAATHGGSQHGDHAPAGQRLGVSQRRRRSFRRRRGARAGRNCRRHAGRSEPRPTRGTKLWPMRLSSRPRLAEQGK